MNGFERELQTRILGVIPHALIKSDNPINYNNKTIIDSLNVEGVEAYGPYIELQGLIGSDDRSRGVFISGIVPESENKMSILPEFMVRGSLSDLKDKSGVVIGSWLSRYLNLQRETSIYNANHVLNMSTGLKYLQDHKFKLSFLFSHKASDKLSYAYGILKNLEDAVTIQHYYREKALSNLSLEGNSIFYSSNLISKPRPFNSCINTLKDSGKPASGIFSPLTIASYAFALPITSSDFTVSISWRALEAP